MIRAAIDWARSTLTASDPEEFDPLALFFLLRECTRASDPALRDVVERGLTRALEAVDDDRDACRKIEWVRLLVEASDLSDDERLREAARRALPDAVDALESHVRRLYEPGEGLLGASCAAQLQCACALLSAFDLSGRVPYAMLAEELLRHARRRWWHDSTGSFGADLTAACFGLRACVRLAALHADAGYRARAVVGPAGDLAGDARRMADAVARRARESPECAGAAGLALSEWFALESDLQ